MDSPKQKEMDEQNPTDQDSMMVLQALLNIRRDTIGSSMTVPCSPVMMTPDRLGVPNPLAVGSMSNAVPSYEEMARHGFSPDACDHNSSASNIFESEPFLEDIRRSKINDALRSKPQRGRKRDELSAEERMELTRTRNREHAKSTRVRKKVRYQELLDQEQRFEDFKQAEALRAKRIESFQSYLMIRQGMLRARLGISNGSNEKPLSDVLAEGFSLEGQSIHHLDTTLVEQLSSHGNHYANVCYLVQENAIAINQDGTGFAEVTVLTDDVPFITAFTKFQFRTGCPKLASMCWCPIRTAPRESLSCQKSYPSVVSLDPTFSNSVNHADFEDSTGLGMSLND